MGRLLEMADDDPVQLRELVGMYVKESTDVMRNLKVSVQAGDWDQTERLAHRLGGTSAVCGMIPIVRPLRDLEMTAKAGHRSFNEMLLVEASREHARVTEYLEGLGLTEVAQ
jgi:HPt (histidine-containing phosphotransfer) domain-containing protein